MKKNDKIDIDINENFFKKHKDLDQRTQDLFYEMFGNTEDITDLKNIPFEKINDFAKKQFEIQKEIFSDEKEE